MCLSPESGLEKVRKKNKGHFYSNKEFLDCLAYLKECGVSAEVFLTYGIPGETHKDLQETIRLKNFIRKHFDNVGCIRVLSIEMEPGAPWHLEPGKYGIINERIAFGDFYNAHSSKYNQTFSSLGYYIPKYFPDNFGINDASKFEKELQKIKCRHFCFLSPSPRKSGPAWKGRAFCSFLHLMDRIMGKKTTWDRIPVIPKD